MAVICDGMGGLDMGEVASSAVINAFNDWFSKRIRDIFDLSDMEGIQKEWTDLLGRLNLWIGEYSEKRCLEMGTTFTGMMIRGEELMAVHVGDSRIYHIGSVADQLTEDHTFVAREVKRGNMTPEEAESDIRRNLLLQCVGASRNIAPQIIRRRVEPGTYLLCSDGFRHEITGSEMAEAFSFKKNSGKKQVHSKARQMIDRAKSRGEQDNISVIVISGDRRSKKSEKGGVKHGRNTG